MTAREIDIHTLPSMLTALRLPELPQALGRNRHPRRYRRLARRPLPGRPDGIRTGRARHASLAARHLNEAQLPAGKTLATFDFKALPTLPRARVEALAAGDWLDGGGNLIAIGNSGPDQTHGKTHILCAIGHALVEAGYRVFYTRTSDLVQRLQAARRDLVLEAALAKLDLTSSDDPSPGRLANPPPPRRHHLCPQGSG